LPQRLNLGQGKSGGLGDRTILHCAQQAPSNLDRHLLPSLLEPLLEPLLSGFDDRTPLVLDKNHLMPYDLGL
jgi:hypothetical protein